ncbi:CPBP family intramembrane metalloprotease [Parvularcula sp. ZS-1/3]|uniref:CPBP family intramembrane metalloprotease n=1 Tax=Parvularcula mediterranea TaxID=2732508 RepID=A0A7Y3RP34_9PROT|nr:CPBP family intramembrane glutamic endopeptidase [Parvularcula mediterranea]NNU17628.1 CPBP family intramembrane metalloprotease [Parvularcula mediterranea]
MLSERAIQMIVFETGALAVWVGLGVLLMRGRVRWAWLGGALALALIGKVLVFLGADGAFGDWIGGRYNWEGKIVTAGFWLVATLAIFWGRLGKVGLTLSQNGPAPKLGIGLAVATAIATGLFMALYFPGTKTEPAVDMAYQAAMPSIEEELWFRGLLLGMLIMGFTRKGMERAGTFAVLVAALITALHFWSVHSIFTDGSWGFEFRPFWNVPTLFYGLLWVGVRLGTGSLLLPILLHTWANTADYFL